MRDGGLLGVVDDDDVRGVVGSAGERGAGVGAGSRAERRTRHPRDRHPPDYVHLET